MKVAVLSTPVFICPPKGYSGLETLAWQQAAGLAALGHQVVLFAPDGSTCPGVEIFGFGPAGHGDEFHTFTRYADALANFDVILDSTWTKCALSLKEKGTLKAPVLSICHAPLNTMFQSLPPVEKPCFVCISEDQASYMRGCFEKDCRVAYNGIDLDYYKPQPNVQRTNRFLFLARFSSIKGPDLAIRACREAGVGLDLVGDTSITHEPEYFEMCKQACDGHQIRMVGPATRAECVRWFSQAHCLLHPNERFREPFGLAPVESMSCQTPVIAWRRGAMKETVDHGRTGFLVSSYAEMLDLIRSGAVNSIDRRHCREWASQFSVQAMVHRYDELITEACDSGGW